MKDFRDYANINKLLKYTSLRTKIGVMFGISIFVIMLVMITFTIITSRDRALKNAVDQSTAVANQISNNIQVQIETALNTARTVSQTFSTTKDPLHPVNINRQQAVVILRNIISQNPSFIGTLSVWEPNLFDKNDSIYRNTPGHDKTGRFIPYWSRIGTNLPILEPAADYETPGRGEFYLIPKSIKKEIITEPFNYSVQGHQTYMVTASSPIISNEIFYGIVGIDISVDWIQEIVDNQMIFNGAAHVVVFSSNGNVIASSASKNLIGHTLKEIVNDPDDHILDIKNGVASTKFVNGDLEVVQPVYFGQSKTPWEVYIMVPASEINANILGQAVGLIIISIILLLITLFFVIYMLSKIVKPLMQISDVAENVAQGDLDYPEISTEQDEIGMVNQSFKDMIKSLQEVTDVSLSITQGDFSKRIHVKSEKDTLAKTLNQMIETLKKAEDEDTMRKKMDEQRIWITQGLAKFGELLRQSSQSLVELADDILSNLVHYINANQAGLFFMNDDDKEQIYLEMISAYAYDRKKYLQKRIEIGEGLIGGCALEKKTLYMIDIPEDYMLISSGFGQANPNCLLVVPLKLEDTVYGIVEIAAFDEIENYKIEFVEKLAESIASAMANVKVSLRTSKLLEQSKRQAEELASQEEEMRQNLEELLATQEASARKEAEITSLVNGLNATFLVAEFDLESNYLNVNDNFVELMQTSREQLLSRNLIKINAQKYTDIWMQLKRGLTVRETSFIKSNNKWISSTYTPIFDSHGNAVKVLSIGTDVTDQKLFEAQLQEQTEIMREKQRIIEDNNKKLEENSALMQKALQQAQESEEEIKKTNAEMQLQRSELEKNIDLIKAQQEEMAKGKAEMQSILDAINSTIGTIEYELDGKILGVNDQLLRQTGSKYEDFMGKYHRDFRTEEERTSPAYKKLWDDLIAGIIRVGERKYILADGREGWNHESYTPIRDENGQIFKVLAMFINITATKKLQNEFKLKNDELMKKEVELQEHLEELRITQQELASNYEETKIKEENINKILNSAPQTILTLDQKYNIIFANLTAEKQLGLSQDELIGKNIQLILKAIKLDRLVSGFKTTTRATRFDDTGFAAELIVANIDENQSHHILLFLTDITELKEKEQDLVLTLQKSDTQKRALKQTEAMYRTKISNVIEIQNNIMSNISTIIDDINKLKTEFENNKVVQELEKMATEILDQLDKCKNELV